MSETTTLTICISTETKERLEKLAAAHHRSKAYLTVQALERFLEEERHITRRIRKGIELADRGEFVPDEEVEALFRKWARKIVAAKCARDQITTGPLDATRNFRTQRRRGVHRAG